MTGQLKGTSTIGHRCLIFAIPKMQVCMAATANNKDRGIQFFLLN